MPVGSRRTQGKRPARRWRESAVLPPGRRHSPKALSRECELGRGKNVETENSLVTSKRDKSSKIVTLHRGGGRARGVSMGEEGT